MYLHILSIRFHNPQNNTVCKYYEIFFKLLPSEIYTEIKYTMNIQVNCIIGSGVAA